MISPSSSESPAISPRHFSAGEREQLQQALRRCPPGTFEAACELRRTGDLVHLTPLLRGVIERYVDRDLRPRLKSSGDDTRLVEDLGIDSLTMMEIVLLAEDVLGISIANEELAKLRTLGDIRAFMALKLRDASS